MITRVARNPPSPYVIPLLDQTPWTPLDPIVHATDILHIVISCYNVTEEDVLRSIKGRRQGREGVVYVRHLYWYFMRELFPRSKFPIATLKWLGRLLNGADHTTVIHALTTMKDVIELEQDLPKTVKPIGHSYRNAADDYYFTKNQIVLWMKEKRLTSSELVGRLGQERTL